MKISFDNTKLKRNKLSLQSTAMHTLKSTRTLPKLNSKPEFFLNDFNNTIKTIGKIPQKIQQKQDQMPQHKFTFGQVELNISQQKTQRQRQNTSKFMRHFYYKGINRTIEHALLSVPPFVTELYEKEQIKRSKTQQKKTIRQPVSFSQGFLKGINCAYYTVQNKIIFIKTQDLLNSCNATIKDVPYFAHQVRNQVVNIVEIVGQTLLFPSYQLVLAVIHPWQIQFYAWQPSRLMKKVELLTDQHIVGQSGLKPLHFIYKLPIETVKHLDYSKDSRLFFFDSKGALHQITPHEQTRLLLLKTGRYNIRNYVNNSHNTFELLSKKHGKFSPVFNMVIKAHQLTKYLFPSKIETLGLFYDRKRQLLFGLLKKNTKLILGSQNQMFIVCYSIKQKQTAYLLHKFSQQYFVQNYGNHMMSQIMNKFAFHSIHPAPYCYQNANLLIITKSGIRIVVEVSQDKINIVEVIRPPDYQMFQYNLSTTGSMNNYAPVSKNQYKLQSFYQDDDKAICTVSRDTGSILTYISSNGGSSGAFDINQQTNSINMEIYREGSWNVKIYRVDQAKMMNFLMNPRLNNECMGELTTQTIQSAGLYLFMGESKTQLMSYLRPIDILFTCMTVIQKIKQRETKRNRGGTIKLSTEQVLLKIFVNEDRNWSYIVNRSINIKELCTMLLQLVVDKSGIYYYCVDAAKQILAFCEEVHRKSKTQQNSKENNHFQNFSHYLPEEENHSINYTKQLNKKGKKININYFYSYSKIATKTKEQMKVIMQSLSQIKASGESEKNKNINEIDSNPNTFYDFPTASKGPVSTQKIILFRISIAYKYISYLLEAVWDEDVTDIDKKLSYLLIEKLSYLEQYIKNEQNSMKNYDCHYNNITNENLSFEIKQLFHTVHRTKQLLILLNNVTNIRPGYKFSALARLDPKDQTLQEIMFECIHKQYRHFIIQKWNSLFPTFISPSFLQLIALYGQMQEISNKETILFELKRNNFKAFPPYFIQYLTKIRKLSAEEMMQLGINLKDLDKKKQETDYSFNRANDFQFSIPTRIKELSEKYRRQAVSLTEPDVQQILSICLNKDDSKSKQLTISNMQLLITYILKNFPTHPKIQYVSRCMSVQYELYRYYLKKIAQHKTENQSRVKSIGINRLFKSQADLKVIQNLQNPETIQLLRFHVLTDRQKIKKLVWASADLWVMADFCATFNDLDQLKIILRQVCQQFESQKNRKFSSFSSYIETFLLNIAIKSQYSIAVVALICQLVDEYLQSLTPVKKLLKEWVKFQSLSAITNKIFCLPQILIKVGYNPQVVLKVYLQQMQNIFDKNVPLENQLIYGLKTLNSYILIDMYVRDKGRELAKVLNLQLNALQRVGNLKEGIKEGMKKLMDGLVEKCE